MSKRARAWLVWSLFLVGGRVADLWTTWSLDPQLHGERNPLHTFVGAGFGVLVLVSLVLVAAFSAGAWWAAPRRLRMLPRRKGLSFAAFAGHWLRVAPAGGSTARGLYLMADGGAFVVAAFSYLVALSNLGVAASPAYGQLLAAALAQPVALMLLLACLGGALWSIWLALRYLDYRSAVGPAFSWESRRAAPG